MHEELDVGSCSQASSHGSPCQRRKRELRSLWATVLLRLRAADSAGSGSPDQERCHALGNFIFGLRSRRSSRSSSTSPHGEHGPFAVFVANRESTERRHGDIACGSSVPGLEHEGIGRPCFLSEGGLRQTSPLPLPAARCRANSRNMHLEAPTAPQRLANYAAFALLALTLARTAWLALAGIQLGSWDVCITPALAVWAAYGIPRKRKDGWIAAGLLTVFAGVFGLLAAWAAYLRGSTLVVGLVAIALANLGCFLVLFALPKVRHIFEPPRSGT